MIHTKIRSLAFSMVVGTSLLAASTAVAAEAAKTEAPKTADARKADNLKSVAKEIDGYVFKFPCAGEMPENPKKGADALSALVPPGGDPKKQDNFSAVKKFGGEKGKRYLVTLRFRGVVEPMMYKDGKKDGDLFYIGGEPNNATYNIYKISISAPESHYFLNRQDAVGHRTFKIDYTKTIEVEGGATVTFFGDGQNGHLISNFDKLVVEGVSPEIKQPFHGQFVQADVVSVEEKK